MNISTITCTHACTVPYSTSMCIEYITYVIYKYNLFTDAHVQYMYMYMHE